MKTAADTILDAHRSVDPAAPLVTFYDVADGTRIELSTLSLGNWAAKIAGLLRDEIGLDVGADVLLDLPPHWLTPGVLLGVWWAGARVRTSAEGDDDPAAVIVAAADRIDAHDDADELLVMSTHPMGLGLAASGIELPVGVTDLVDSCRVHPDAFIPGGGVADCLESSTLADLAEEVAVVTGGSGAAARVLVDAHGRADIVRDCAAVLAAGGSLVLVSTGRVDRQAAEAELDKIAATERVTARL